MYRIELNPVTNYYIIVPVYFVVVEVAVAVTVDVEVDKRKSLASL